jgi:hypothetical protein
MKPEFAYRYTVLRYEHDVRTQEFLNVGLLFWIPNKYRLVFRHTDKKSRLTAAFPDAEADELIDSLRQLANRITDIEPSQMKSDDLLAFAHLALPSDDGSLKWSAPSAGCTDNPQAALGDVFDRLVARYERRRERRVRTNNDLWHVFANHLRPYDVLQHFHQAVIKTPMRRYEFDHSWQNHCPHIVAPVSLDGGTKEAVADKATQWAGQIMDLDRSREDFKLNLVLGEPAQSAFHLAYESAVELLARDASSDRIRVVQETEMPLFAEELAEEMRTHLGEVK